jgi:hypothetical protein
MIDVPQVASAYNFNMPQSMKLRWGKEKRWRANLARTRKRREVKLGSSGQERVFGAARRIPTWAILAAATNPRPPPLLESTLRLPVASLFTLRVLLEAPICIYPILEGEYAIVASHGISSVAHSTLALRLSEVLLSTSRSYTLVLLTPRKKNRS